MVTLEEFLDVAREINASDLHLTAALPPKVRIDGELRDLHYPKLSSADVENIANRLMNDRQKEILDKYGEVDFAFSVPQVGRCRVSVFKQRGSLACSMRIVRTAIPAPEEIGMPQPVVNLYDKKRGLVLVTGPAGSGKSTTLASIINKINQEKNVHIITLEDPIEYLHSHDRAMINQREIGIDTTSYLTGLKAALREDPDVILVGEMRDTETISTAIMAAETGHLVFSALHTIGASSTIERIIELFPSEQQHQVRIQLAEVLEAVISQQLVPAANGHGRVAAFEVMNGTSHIKNLIREGKIYQIETAMGNGRKEGMITMDDALAELCAKGKISSENAVNYAKDAGYAAKKTGEF